MEEVEFESFMISRDWVDGEAVAVVEAATGEYVTFPIEAVPAITHALMGCYLDEEE